MKTIDQNYIKTKLILFIAKDYLDKLIKEENVSFDGKLRKIYYGLRNFAVLHKFTTDEAKLIKNMDDSKLKEMTDVNISFIMFALALVQEWSKEHPHFCHNFGVNYKTLTNATALYAMDMIMLKHRDKSKYDETKEIINDSKLLAKKFYVESFYNIKL